jgi:translocon-associated protein subunit delta
LLLTDKLLPTSICFAIFATATSSACENPKVTASSYTPTDAQALTHIPFIAEFSLTCKGVVPTGDVPIYANVEGHMVQVARSKDGSKYQVGWTTEMKAAKTGDYEISLYDEDGYAAVKRVVERG